MKSLRPKCGIYDFLEHELLLSRSFVEEDDTLSSTFISQTADSRKTEEGGEAGEGEENIGGSRIVTFRVSVSFLSFPHVFAIFTQAVARERHVRQIS